MKVSGISMVRNEADLLPITLPYHLAQGLDELVVVDNGSTDDTPRVLARLGRDPRIRWTRNDGPFFQGPMTVELVRDARRRGADWVLVFDADEFWHAPGGDLRGVLEASRAGALQVAFTNFVQRRSQRRNDPHALLHAVFSAPVHPAANPESEVASGRIAFVEAAFPPKWLVRPTADYQASRGTHLVEGVAGPLEETTAIVCLHVPLRSRQQLEEKATHGPRVLEADYRPGQSWQKLRWMEQQRAGTLAAEWEANSQRDGALDVYGTRHPVVYDPRLRDILRPFVPRPWRWFGPCGRGGR